MSSFNRGAFNRTPFNRPDGSTDTNAYTATPAVSAAHTCSVSIKVVKATVAVISVHTIGTPVKKVVKAAVSVAEVSVISAPVGKITKATVTGTHTSSLSIVRKFTKPTITVGHSVGTLTVTTLQPIFLSTAIASAHALVVARALTLNRSATVTATATLAVTTKSTVKRQVSVSSTSTPAVATPVVHKKYTLALAITAAHHVSDPAAKTARRLVVPAVAATLAELHKLTAKRQVAVSETAAVALTYGACSHAAVASHASVAVRYVPGKNVAVAAEHALSVRAELKNIRIQMGIIHAVSDPVIVRGIITAGFTASHRTAVGSIIAVRKRGNFFLNLPQIAPPVHRLTPATDRPRAYIESCSFGTHSLTPYAPTINSACFYKTATFAGYQLVYLDEDPDEDLQLAVEEVEMYNGRVRINAGSTPALTTQLHGHLFSFGEARMLEQLCGRISELCIRGEVYDRCYVTSLKRGRVDDDGLWEYWIEFQQETSLS